MSLYEGNYSSSPSRINRAAAKVLPARFSAYNPDYTLQRVMRHLSGQVFFALDRVGVHLLPKHYYTPVADYAWLRKNGNLWRNPVDMRGVDWDLDAQLSWLRSVCEPYYHEVVGLKSYEAMAESAMGPGYGPIESQILHCFIRGQRPRLVIEIGSGVSTLVTREAARLNERDGAGSSRIIAIEPYPRPNLRSLPGVELIESMAQEAPLSIFDQLEAGDLLFIDSTHAVKIGSDAVRICLEIIPRLKPGVFIHYHDITLPYLYPRTALTHFFGWQETALVLAMLNDSSRISVLCGLSALHYDRTSELAAIATDYRPQENDDGLLKGDPNGRHCPDSLWLQTH
jgi:hypothetical protein